MASTLRPVRVHHLNCGSMFPAVIGRLVCHVLLCELDDRLVLVDTGFGLSDVADPAGRLGVSRRLLAARLDPAETAIRQVEALGFAATDVRDIVLTHFDLDHVGGLADFPHAAVHVTAAEWAAANHPLRRERSRYRPAQWAHGPKIVTHEPAGERWEGLLARPLDELDGALALVSLPGHTRGHAAVAVDGPDGWLLHAGDAYFHRAVLGDRAGRTARTALGLGAFEHLVAADVRKLSRNHDVLAELRRRFPVFCAHDPVELDRYTGKV